MKYPKLIILYGRFGNKVHEKQQKMITGESTCGYRPYAEKFGEIIYLCPQVCTQSWDRSISDYSELLIYLQNQSKDSIIWSVKHDPTGKKDQILSQLPNKKVYYSCCSYNMHNTFADISLVDTSDRLYEKKIVCYPYLTDTKTNAHLWVKGKDPSYWYPVRETKLVDYLFIGKRGDKNEVWFINELTKQVRAERSILWIGGEKHQSKIKPTHHKVICAPFMSMNDVRDLICTARVGLVLSEIRAEGFPQTFLEMTMCDVPVLYFGPINRVYQKNCINPNLKRRSIDLAESMLYDALHDIYKGDPRQYAIENYSLEKSYESILRGLK